MPRLELDSPVQRAPHRLISHLLAQATIDARTVECPSADEIRRSVDQDRSIFETRELVEHLSGCASCFASWREARATRRGSVLSFPTRTAPSARRSG